MQIFRGPAREGADVDDSMRYGNFRYTEWHANHTGELVARELYDHSAGSLVSANMVEYPGNEALVTQLGGRMNAW